MRAPRLYGPGQDEPEPLRPVPDLGGTPVDDAEGRYAGRLHGSLADADSGLIRFFDVALADDRRHVLVPIGDTRVERDWRGRPRIRLLAASKNELRTIPDGPADGPVGRETGRAVTRAHGRLFHGERYYAHPAYDHRGLYAGEHPIIRGESAPYAPRQLRPLADLPDFHIAADEPDIRRWPLELDDGHTATIDDVVVDPDAGKVRYAIVSLDSGRRPVLVPVGYLRVRRDARVVEAPALRAADLRALPQFRGGALTRSIEDRVRSTLEDRLDGDGRHFRRPDYGPAADRPRPP